LVLVLRAIRGGGGGGERKHCFAYGRCFTHKDSHGHCIKFEVVKTKKNVLKPFKETESYTRIENKLLKNSGLRINIKSKIN